MDYYDHDYETKLKQRQHEAQQSKGCRYPADAIGGFAGETPTQGPCVAELAYRTAEEAAGVFRLASALLDDLKPRPESDALAQPARSGIDGKLHDAQESMRLTNAVLFQIRQYLLG